MSGKCILWAMKQGLPCPQKFLLFVMADNGGEDGICEMSAPHLRERCGLSERAYKMAITMLQKKRLIEEMSPGKSFNRRYALNLPRSGQ